MPKPPKGMFRRSGRPSWYTRVYSRGRDLLEAKRKLRRVRNTIPRGDGSTVAELASVWLETDVKIRRNDVGQELAKRRVEMYLVPQLGKLRADRVTKTHLRQYRLSLEGIVSDRTEKPLSSRTVAHVLADARAFFRWAEDEGHIDRAPIPRRLLPRIQEQPPDRLTDDQADELRALPGPHGLACRLALATGLRWGELTRAQASDVQNGALVVHQTKSGKVRRVPLPEDLVGEVRGHVGRLVPFRSAGSFRNWVRRNTAVQDFHPHMLRHTFACQWLDRGGSLEALQELLGHAHVGTTQRYGRLSDGYIRAEAVRVWGRSLSQDGSQMANEV